MGRGAASQSHRASVGEINPPAGQFYYSDDKHELRIPRVYRTPGPNVSLPAWLGLGAIAVALIALTAVLVLRLERQSLSALQHTYVVIISSLDMLSNLEDADVRAREYILTGEPLYLEGYRRSREAVNEEFIRLRELARDHPQEQEEVHRLEDLVQRQLGELQKTVDTRSAVGLDAARTLIIAARGHQLMDAIRHDINRIAMEEQITLHRFSYELQRRLGTSVAALTGSALLAGCFLLIGRIVLVRITSLRQRTEEDLRVSESRFETLCDQAPLGIFEADAEGRWTYTNRRWTEVSGLSATESLGHGWAKALHPEDRAPVFEGWQTAAHRGAAWEYRVVTDQGETRWIRALGGPIYSALGVLTGYVGTVEDATERKQAAERFRLVVEAATSGMVMSDRNGKILLVNSRTEKLFGYEREELLGQSIEILAAESSRDLFLGLHKEFHVQPLAGVMGFAREVNARRKDGTQFPVEIGLTPIEEGISMLISILDITERKRAEAELRESEERFRNMADTAPVLIWVAGPDKLCTFFNKVWLEFTGRTMEQELGQGWAQGVHRDDLDRCIATYSASFDARRRFRMEYRLRRADGEYRWILDDGAPRFTSEGIFAGYIGSCVDITERRLAEEERQKFVSLADRSLEFVAMSDLDFRPFYVNIAGMRLVGLDNLEAARQIRAQDCFFPEDQLFITNEFFPRVLRDGHGEVEIRFRHFKTGAAIWMLFNVFSISDSCGTNVGWATVSINVTERKQSERALQQSRQELRALAGRLIDAQEEERKRISRELHDDINQKLALLAFDTGSLVLAPPPSADRTREKFRDLQTRVVQLSEDVRQISHRLHPSILEDLGLTAALRELCEEFSAREGIEVVFEQEAVPQALPVDVASCLYRVSQEALHNVLKHARANRVRLKVSGSPEGIRLCIHDTGVGFDSESVSSRHGLGIVSMKERVRLVQGKFSIHSQPGQGTTIEISVPLSKEAI
jgi:PAS domain S-box-containing protein